MTIHEFIGLSVFAPLLINGDDSGIERGEGFALDRFCQRNGYFPDIGHFSIPPNEESFFGTCEITGARGNVCTFHFVQMRKRVSSLGGIS